MRRDQEPALSVADKIDDVDTRAQTEDDVYLVQMQKAFAGGHDNEARTLALKFNDPSRRAKWLAQIAGRVSPRSKDHTEAADLLSQAYSIAEKSDNTPAKLEVLCSSRQNLYASITSPFEREQGVIGKPRVA